MGLLTAFAVRLWLLYQHEDAGRPMPFGYWQTPIVWTDARAIIQSELRAIEAEIRSEADPGMGN